MNRTYKKIELVGIANEGYEKAIQNAIGKASQTLEDMAWFEVIEQRGKISSGKVVEYQVIIKVAFKLK